MFRAVLDTNTVLAASTSFNDQSAAREIIERWKNRVIEILWCDDMLKEYAEVLLREGVSPDDTREFIRRFRDRGERVELVHFHEASYPDDIDDVNFLLCALNGNGSHIVTHDNHLHALADTYQEEVRICYPGQFIGELNERIRILIDLCLTEAIIEENQGHWFYYKGERICQGREQLFQRLVRDGALLKELV